MPNDSNIKGLTVWNLMPNSKAEKAGVKIGDVILAVNGVAIYTAADYAEQASRISGDMKLDILRNNSLHEIVFSYNTPSA